MQKHRPFLFLGLHLLDQWGARAYISAISEHIDSNTYFEKILGTMDVILY